MQKRMEQRFFGVDLTENGRSGRARKNRRIARHDLFQYMRASRGPVGSKLSRGGVERPVSGALEDKVRTLFGK